MPHGFRPSSVTFVSPGHGWVLGDAPCSTPPCTSILRTRDGGRSWAGVPAPVATLGSPESGRNGDVAVLRFADDLDGWAGVGKLFSTHDGGAHWHPVSLAGLVGVVANVESGGGWVFAATDGCPSEGGSHCSRTTRVYASPVGRDDWRPVTRALPGGGGSTHLTVHGADWFVETSVGIEHGSGRTDAGRLPSPCATIANAGPRPDLAAADAQHLDALCVGNGGAGSAEYHLVGSTDGGRSWRPAGPRHVEPSTSYGISDNGQGVLLVAAASGANVVLRTADDGGSFATALSVPAGGIEWADLGFTTATQAVVVLHGQALYVSRDAGRSFAKVSFG